MKQSYGLFAASRNTHITKAGKSKIILCTSATKNIVCRWNECSFAHDIREQNVDPARMLLYNIILDKKEANRVLSKQDIDDIYVLCETCSGCLMGTCQGGLNCRNGAYRPTFKICRNDLNHCCINKSVELLPDRKLIAELFPEIELEDNYYGCLNGHHLSTRGIKSDTSEMQKISHKEIEDIEWSSESDFEIDIDDIDKI